MGIFLGYPIEDVIGYLKNNGKNSICVGYWKVYKDKEEKQKLFKEFECAKNNVIRYLAQIGLLHKRINIQYFVFVILKVTDLFVL